MLGMPKHTFFSDWWRKLLALCLGLLLFYYLNKEAVEVKRVEKVSVYILTEQMENYKLVRQSREDVALYVRGSELKQTFVAEGFRVRYKLTAADVKSLEEKGRSTDRPEIDVYLTKKNIEVEPAFEKKYKGVDLNLQPDPEQKDKVKLHLVFEKIKTKTVPVVFDSNVVNEPEKRACIVPKNREGNLVTLRGRSSLLAGITEVRTKPIEVKDKTIASFDEQVYLDVNTLKKQNIEIENHEDGIPVQVEIVNAKDIIQHNFYNVQINVLISDPQRFNVEIVGGVLQARKIVVSGKKDMVAFLERVHPLAYIDLREYEKAGVHNVPVKLMYWEQVGGNSVAIEPSTLKVKLTHK